MGVFIFKCILLLGIISGLLIDNMIANGTQAEDLVKNIKFGPIFYIPDNLLNLQDQQFVQLAGQFCCPNAFIKIDGDGYNSNGLSFIEGSWQKLTITVVHAMFSLAKLQTKVINCNSANKSCLLQVVHTKAISALMQCCNFFRVGY